MQGQPTSVVQAILDPLRAEGEDPGLPYLMAAEWDDYRFSVTELETFGDDAVFDVHIETRGRHSQIPLAADLTHVGSIRDGRLRRVRIFPSRRRALAALEGGSGR